MPSVLLILRGQSENLVQTDLWMLLHGWTGPFGTAESVDGVSHPSPKGDETLIVTYDLIAPFPDLVVARISALANTMPINILVAGVASNFQIQGRPITERGGVHYGPAEFPTGTDGDPEKWVYIFYDLEECSGKGYHVFDAAGQQIAMPRTAVLYHELAHAYHLAIGDAPVGDNPIHTETLREAQAIEDENAARTVLAAVNNVKKVIRDPANHDGGCGLPPGQKSSGSWTGLGKCFLMTATAPDDVRLPKLRRFRDDMLRRTPTGDALFCELFLEYYQYSPGLAECLRNDAQLRETIRLFAVEPLYSFFDHLMAGLPAPAIAAETLELALVRSVDDADASGSTAAEHSFLAQRFHQALAERRDLRFEGGDPPGQIESAVAFAASQMLASPACRKWSTWAIGAPLRLYWHWAEVLQAGEEVPLTRDVVCWLETMPRPDGFASLSTAELACDLRALGIATGPALRLARRWSAWPEHAPQGATSHPSVPAGDVLDGCEVELTARVEEPESDEILVEIMLSNVSAEYVAYVVGSCTGLALDPDGSTVILRFEYTSGHGQHNVEPYVVAIEPGGMTTLKERAPLLIEEFDPSSSEWREHDAGGAKRVLILIDTSPAPVRIGERHLSTVRQIRAEAEIDNQLRREP